MTSNCHPRSRAAATCRPVRSRDRTPRRKESRYGALACYLAGLCEHSDALVPGERGVLLCVALDQRVASLPFSVAIPSAFDNLDRS